MKHLGRNDMTQRFTMRHSISLAASFAVVLQPGLRAQQPAPQTPQTAPTVNGGHVSTPGSSQATRNPDGTYTIQTSTRIVILDVVATDAKGNMVSGLSKSDFHVTEAGDAQTITNFEVGESRLPDPSLDIESTADLDRLAPRAPVNIILLDEFNTLFEDMAFARDSLKKFLQHQPDHLITPTMLIAVSLDKFDVLHDYTQNKQALIDSLDHHFSGSPWRNTSNSWASERYGTAFLTLRRVAEAVTGHQGRKNMIWIGRGFPSINLADVPLDSSNRINTYRQDCVNSLRDARVTLTTIDPAGLMVDPGVYGAAAAFNDPFGGNYQFAKIAQATGGRTIYGRNDVDAQIGAAALEGIHFYTLVYHPTNTSNDPSKFRKIVVTVDRPGVTLSTRQGYYLSYGPGRVDPKAPSRRLMSDLASAEDSNMSYDGVDMAVTPVPGTPLSYVIHVAARSVGWYFPTATEPFRHTELVLAVTTYDRKGKLLKQSANDMKFKAPENASPTGRIEVPLNFPLKLDPDSKAVRARVVVRLGTSGRIGTADLDLTKPPVIVTATPSTTGPAITNPQPSTP
jgi:VWFA-related protein